LKLLGFVNSYHENIKYTCMERSCGILSYLVVMVEIKDSVIVTDVLFLKQTDIFINI
jgi:hypothetical protein